MKLIIRNAAQSVCECHNSMQIASQFLSDLVGKVVEIFGEGDEHDVRVPQRRLNDGPVGHAAVARNGVKVEVAVQVVFRPFDL